MNDIQHCPDACKIRLKHIEDNQRDHTHEGLWEEIRMKVGQKMFLWIMGVAVVILMATLGFIYQQGGVTLEKVQAALVEQATIQETLKNHTESSKQIKEWMNRESERDS